MTKKAPFLNKTPLGFQKRLKNSPTIITFYNSFKVFTFKYVTISKAH
jgi:hypothetical protein